MIIARHIQIPVNLLSTRICPRCGAVTILRCAGGGCTPIQQHECRQDDVVRQLELTVANLRADVDAMRAEKEVKGE